MSHGQDDKADQRLLDADLSTSATNQPIESDSTAFNHRCALEHSAHFKEQNQKARRACKKLVLVAMVSFIFCGVEAVGGLESGSLAILCDAAHQLSDVAGFVISFLALYLMRKPVTLKHSYGYNRADAVGALGSILIIWGLLIWLLIEATHRLLNPTEIDGELMLIVACFGLGCNIANLLILNFCCNEKDEKGREKHLFESIASAYKPMSGGKISTAIKQQKRTKSQASRSLASSQRGSQLEQYDADAANLGDGKPKIAEESPGHLMSSSHQKLNSTLRATQESSPEGMNSVESPYPKQSQLEEIKEEERFVTSKDNDAPDVESVPDEDFGEQENLNVRAAIVHMIGDMLQSAGVIVAALIIYFKPDWTIADPICTYIFSVLVMFTTVPIFKDCMRFLMERAPEDIDTVELYNAINNLPVVKEIHDFHLWAISDEKAIFTAHVVTEHNPSYALYCITELVQKDYGIYHSTVQIEPAKASHYDKKGSGMLRCVNEHNFRQPAFPELKKDAQVLV